MKTQNWDIQNLCDVTLEREVLHALISDHRDEAVLMAGARLKPEVFSDAGALAVFETIRDLEERNRPITLDSVRAQMRQRSPGSEQHLMAVVAGDVAVAIDHAVGSLEEWHRKRSLHRAYLRGLEDIHSGVSAAESARVSGRMIDEAVLDTGETIPTYRALKTQYEQEEPLPLYPTGVSFIDTKLRGGLEAGKLVLLFGDPEAGKTSLGTQILRNISRHHKVLFFPFEFSSKEFIKTNAINETFPNGRAKFNQDNFYIDTDSTDLADLEVRLKLFAMSGGRVVLIDSQMMVTNNSNRGTVEEKETEKFTVLQRLCIRYGLTVLFICQQGKEDTRSGTVTPMKTKNGAHAAHIILYVKKPKVEFDAAGNVANKGEREIIFYKNKQTGRYGTKPVKIDPRTLEFSGRQYDEDDHRSSKTVGSGRKPKPPVEVVYEDSDGTVTETQPLFEVPPI